jgi:hypothetical protein
MWNFEMHFIRYAAATLYPCLGTVYLCPNIELIVHSSHLE